MIKILRNPAALLSFVGAILTLCVTAGLPVTNEMREAILGATSALLTLIGVFALQTTPDTRVVSKLDLHGNEIAGTASPLPNGTAVQHIPAPHLEIDTSE